MDGEALVIRKLSLFHDVGVHAVVASCARSTFVLFVFIYVYVL